MKASFADCSRILQSLSVRPPSEIVGFAYRSPGIPLWVAQKDGKPVLLITSLVSRYKYHTARTPEAEISTRMLTTLAFPIQKKVHSTLSNHDVFAYYGITITYATEDFVTGDGGQRQTLCIVSPAEAVGRFNSLEILDRQLLRES